jgi:hypothetical protein
MTLHKVSPTVSLDLWYDRALRLWCGRYVDRNTGNQLGEAWYDGSREMALIHRPATPSAH